MAEFEYAGKMDIMLDETIRLMAEVDGIVDVHGGWAIKQRIKHMPEHTKLRAFLSYASEDETAVRELYLCLKTEAWIDPWLDKEELIPGHAWELEISSCAGKKFNLPGSRRRQN